MDANILVVDDEEGISTFLARTFNAFGSKCDEANTIEKAIELLTANDYDIVVTDKNIFYEGSAEGGMSLVKFIRDFDPTIPVIVMTGYATVENAVESMKLGAFDYVLKPFQIQELKEKVERALEYRRFFDPESIMDLYKAIQDKAFEIIEMEIDGAQRDHHLVIKSFQQKLDSVFHTLKKWEQIMISQRESLAETAANIEQLRDMLPEETPARELADEILNKANKRL